jgi:selenocysteine lyase/cysteine desulfurase
MAHVLDVAHARSKFPALKSGFIFADNAGGSQITQSSIDLIVDYLSNTNVQLGADYSVSVTSTQRVASAAEEARKLFGATDQNEIVFGPSSTANLENLARGLEEGIKEGDEFIITGEHEGEPDLVLCDLRFTRSYSKLRSMEETGRTPWCNHQILALFTDEPQQPVLA